MTAPVPAFNVLETAAPSPRITGSILRAPVGTALPADSKAALLAAYKDLGYAGDDGLTRTEDRSNTDQFAWGGDMVAVLQEKFGITLKFKLLQVMNVDVLESVHGESNVTVVAATSAKGKETMVKLNSKLLDTGVWVFDGYYQKNDLRLVIPIGRVTQMADLKWSHKELSAYDVTLKVFPDASGNHGYQHYNDGTPDGSVTVLTPETVKGTK